MSTDVRKKLVGAAVALALMALGGMALAAEAPGPSLQPKGTDQTSTDASDQSDASDAAEAQDDQSDDTGEPGHDATEHPDNHGADVSTAAHDCPHEGHGDCVSAVARAGDHAQGDDDATEAQDQESEAPDDESSEAPEADDQGEDAGGSGHGQGHGHGG
jgi:hypothetical protein